MLHTRQAFEKMEATWLAPYAVRSAASKGRLYPETEHDYRSAFQRDRESILHTTAFRRLMYKTQVFVYSEGDAYRTRLTHTLEVAQIGRAIARALGVNEDLTETIALAHDLGHPPFGHAGERALRDLMRENGGFEHNRQALRVVDVLEQRRSPRGYSGLNLTWEVREGILKHETRYDQPDQDHEFEPNKIGTLEAQIVAAADVIAYRNHDLDDGLRGAFITSVQLDDTGIEPWVKARQAVEGDPGKDEWVRRHVISFLINLQVNDLIEETASRLQAEAICSVEDVRNRHGSLVSFSLQMQKSDMQLGDFLDRMLYHHYLVERMQLMSDRCVHDLFKAFNGEPGMLPPDIHDHIAEDGLLRTVCDYIASMTDRQALDDYHKLFGLGEFPL